MTREDGDRLRFRGWALWSELTLQELEGVRWPRTVPVILAELDGLPAFSRTLWVPTWGLEVRVESTRLLKGYANPLPRPHTAPVPAVTSATEGQTPGDV